MSALYLLGLFVALCRDAAVQQIEEHNCFLLFFDSALLFCRPDLFVVEMIAAIVANKEYPRKKAYGRAACTGRMCIGFLSTDLAAQLYQYCHTLCNWNRPHPGRYTLLFQQPSLAV